MRGRTSHGFVSIRVLTDSAAILDSFVRRAAAHVSPIEVGLFFNSLAAGAAPRHHRSHAVQAGTLVDAVAAATSEPDTNSADNNFFVTHTVAAPRDGGDVHSYSKSFGVWPADRPERRHHFGERRIPPAAPSICSTSIELAQPATHNSGKAHSGQRGRASLSTSALAQRPHLIRAVYNGSASFDTAIAPAYVLNVRSATTSTWDGGGADDNWTTAANWVGDGGAAPGDALVFPAGAARRSNANDFAPGSLFTNITFTGGDYSLHGNAITLSGSLNDIWTGAEATDLVAMDIALTGASNF